MNKQLVVVGVDGSPASFTALRWALGYVERTAARLRAVRCFRPVAVPAWEAAVTGEPVPPVAAQRLRGDRELDQIVTGALLWTTQEAHVRCRVVDGPVGPGLVAEARHAALLVLGSHGHRRLAHLAHAHGSVSAYCIRHASCPVVVIPPEMGLRGAIPDAPIPGRGPRRCVPLTDKQLLQGAPAPTARSGRPGLPSRLTATPGHGARP